MKKGISFYFGFNTNINERAKKIKEAGFDCVITNADKKFNSQNGSIKQQIKLFKENNLSPSSLHMRYSGDQVKHIWEKGRVGRAFCRRLIKDVKIAKKYNFTCVVVHIKGNANELGFKRLNKILKICEKKNIPLALENLSDQNCLVNIFNRINHNYLKFCYDIGHNNAFDPNFDYLEKYGNKLICLHLHDNSGKRDDHTLNKYGTINWKEFAKKLKDLKFNGSLDYEILMNVRQNETFEDVLNQTHKQALELEKYIENA